MKIRTKINKQMMLIYYDGDTMVMVLVMWVMKNMSHDHDIHHQQGLGMFRVRASLRYSSDICST